MEASRTAGALRQRSVLAKLIALIDHDAAEYIASELISEFQTIGRVFAETEEARARVIGVQPHISKLLLTVSDAIEACLSANLPMTAICATDPDLIRYLIGTMASLPIEHLRVLYLDGGRRLVSNEVVAQGSIGRLMISARAIIKRAMELHASGLIVVHNHPGGSELPSTDDIHATRALDALTRAMDIELCDHLIIAGSKWSSMRRSGVLA